MTSRPVMGNLKHAPRAPTATKGPQVEAKSARSGGLHSHCLSGGWSGSSRDRLRS
jgi:hypothetical protein